ncbi:MAG: Gfo/Idh/MocA family oxidoreductase [Bryobacteraceae bacterium]|nr:Gfo/Idh/MocA family oxidoreductase [Bryobacteraceae bacterium]
MSVGNRRRFLKTAGLGAAMAGAGPLAAQTASSRDAVAGANDRIRVALIGCGGMGRGDLKDFLRVSGVQCVALCDVDKAQMDQTVREIVEPAGQRADLLTQDFRHVVDRNDLDAVIVATPDHWHALPTIMACKSGKDVYVEKPLSITVGEGRVMVDAARKHKRVVQMGTQQRSARHYTDAVEYVKDGKLGKVRLVRAWAYLDWKGRTPVLPDSEPPEGVDYDMWLGPAPKRPFNRNRFHFTFRWYWDYSGGLMTDWGAHMIDIANWAMGIKAPSSAMSVGGKFGYPDDAMETPDTQQVMWQYPSFSMIWEHALGVGRGPEAREHGVQFHGEQGVLVIDRQGWEVYPETDRIDRPDRVYKSSGKPRYNVPANDDMHFAHVKNFLECMRSRQNPRSDVEIGHDSMIACHVANAAFRLGRRVDWDIEKERPIDDRKAEELMKPHYRAPWKLEA